MNRRSDDRRYRRRWCLAVLIAIAATGDAFAQFVLRQEIAIGGGGTVRNPCFALSSTVGEAVASPATAGNFSLSSGFWGARPPATHDSLFRDGFEDCP